MSFIRETFYQPELKLPAFPLFQSAGVTMHNSEFSSLECIHWKTVLCSLNKNVRLVIRILKTVIPL